MDNLKTHLGMFRALGGQTAGIRRAGSRAWTWLTAAGRFDAFLGVGPVRVDIRRRPVDSRSGGLVSDYPPLEKATVAGNTKCFKAVLDGDPAAPAGFAEALSVTKQSAPPLFLCLRLQHA